MARARADDKDLVVPAAEVDVEQPITVGAMSYLLYTSFGVSSNNSAERVKVLWERGGSLGTSSTQQATPTRN